MACRLTEVPMHAHAFPSRPAMGLVAVALLAGWIAQPVAQEGQPQAAPQVFRSGVELITSDVTVLSRDGTSVGDLSIDDFRVTVDGVPRRIATLKYVRAHESLPSSDSPVAPAAGGADKPDAAPVEGGRTIFIAVDRDRIPQGTGRSFLDAAARFVDTLGPQDRVGLWMLPFATKVNDREHLKRELLKATGTMLPVSREQSERKGILWDQSTPPPRRLVTPAGATLNESLHPLERMVASLAPLDGTKHLVLITGGTTIPEGDMMSVTRLSQMAAAARVHIHSLQVWNVLSGIRSDGDSVPQSAPPDQGSTAEAHLSWVTGGITVTSSQGTAGFARLSKELSAWYVVGIEPDAADRDGKSHRLEVKVESRPGAIVRARQQFQLARQ